MDMQKLLCKLHTSSQIVYLDSSCLIRNYPCHALSKNLTRSKFISNPKKFSITLNRFVNPLYDTSIVLYNIFDKITNYIKKFNIITYECMFPKATNCHITSLFGFLNFESSIASVNNSTVLFGENISIETFFYASTLIRSANLILIDDYFLSLSVGKQLFDRKKENTPAITLSSIIGYHLYNTKEVVNTFNYILHHHF